MPATLARSTSTSTSTRRAARFNPRRGLDLFDDEIVYDLFAGGGGATEGISQATGRAVNLAANHDREAITMHAANSPNTVHLCEDVFRIQHGDVIKKHFPRRTRSRRCGNGERGGDHRTAKGIAECPC